MKLKTLLLIVGLFCAVFAQAQNYTKAAGLRFGEHTGIAFKTYQDDYQSMEFMLQGQQQGLTVTFLKEQYKPVLKEINQNLILVTGYGVHVGYRYTDKYENFTHPYYHDSPFFSPILGVDGMLGLEYHVNDYPFVLAVDLKPYFEFSAHQIFRMNPGDMAFSIKYLF